MLIPKTQFCALSMMRRHTLIPGKDSETTTIPLQKNLTFLQLKSAVIADKPEDVKYWFRRIPDNSDTFTAEDRLTLLEMAILKKDVDMMRVMLDEETVHVAKSAVNNNPLVAACSNGFLEGAALLIEFGVDISARSVDGFTCLLAAAKNGHLDVVYYLLMNCSCDLHAIGRDGYTTLHHIAVLDSPEIIVKLICNGADVNAQNWNGETAVYLAAKNNSVDSLEVLLHYGADPDIVTEREDGSISGASALHEAVTQNNVEAVKLLLNFGADIAAIRSDGLTPIEVALSLSPPRQEVIDYLFDASTISEQIKKLALRCAYTEQLLQEQKDEVDEKSVRCKDAEAQLVKLQCEMDKCSNRCELAEQTLKGLQSEMEYCVCCPITFTIMEDPVIASDGHTYERRAIEQWLKNKRESPVTRQPLTSSSLIPNLAVKHLIDHYEGKNSGAFDTS